MSRAKTSPVPPRFELWTSQNSYGPWTFEGEFSTGASTWLSHRLERARGFGRAITWINVASDDTARPQKSLRVYA
jgi:hypothetical protein